MHESKHSTIRLINICNLEKFLYIFDSVRGYVGKCNGAIIYKEMLWFEEIMCQGMGEFEKVTGKGTDTLRDSQILRMRHKKRRYNERRYICRRYNRRAITGGAITGGAITGGAI